jgi:hypothetical protein
MCCRCAWAVAFLALLGCGKVDAPSTSVGATRASLDRRFSLSEEPEGAVDVTELRETAKDGDILVVVGSIGGGIDPWVKDRAAFVLVDACALTPCDESCCDEQCNCRASELADSTVVVKFLDSKGKVIETDARELLGVRALDTVVVRGKAKRDKAGNLAMIAEGLYIRR